MSLPHFIAELPDSFIATLDIKNPELPANFAGLNGDETKIISYDDKGTRKWNPITGKQLGDATAQLNLVRSYLHNKTKTTEIYYFANGEFMAIDIATQKEIKRFIGHSKQITLGELNKDDTRILSGSEDTTIRLWNFETGKELYCLQGHTGPIKSMKLSNDENQIISCSDDGSIKAWTNIQKTLLHDLMKKQYNVEYKKLFLHLSLYKIFLKKDFPEIDRITFEGLAHFLNQREDVQKVEVEDLKNTYMAMSTPLKVALRAIFYTHYKEII